jgi:hypothetical protein
MLYCYQQTNTEEITDTQYLHQLHEAIGLIRTHYSEEVASGLDKQLSNGHIKMRSFKGTYGKSSYATTFILSGIMILEISFWDISKEEQASTLIHEYQHLEHWVGESAAYKVQYQTYEAIALKPMRGGVYEQMMRGISIYHRDLLAKEAEKAKYNAHIKEVLDDLGEGVEP